MAKKTKKKPFPATPHIDAWKRKTKKKLIRVSTEKSQGPWNRTPKQSKKDDLYRKMANRIVELERQIAMLSTGNKGPSVVIHTSKTVLAMLTDLTKSGFWRPTLEETAEEVLRAGLRETVSLPDIMDGKMGGFP